MEVSGTNMMTSKIDSHYTIHSGDEFDTDEVYQVLMGPNGLKVWLTEPEDRNFYRDLNPLVTHLNDLQCQLKLKDQRIAELEANQLNGYLNKCDK